MFLINELNGSGFETLSLRQTHQTGSIQRLYYEGLQSYVQGFWSIIEQIFGRLWMSFHLNKNIPSFYSSFYSWFDVGAFEPIKFFRKFFSPEVWPEVSRKFIDLTSRPKLYQQHRHTISFCYVLVVHSKMWVCLLKDEKGRIYYSKKRGRNC